MAWTDDRVEILSKLWADGLSASQIAKQLGGVTRNAVIGKVHRLGLSGRAKPSRPVKRAPRPASAKARTTAPAVPRMPRRVAPVPTPVPLEAKQLPDGKYATILTITEHMCKWPIGDPATSDFRFCGRGTDKGDPYCKAHAQLAYQPARRRGQPVKTVGQRHVRALR